MSANPQPPDNDKMKRAAMIAAGAYFGVAGCFLAIAARAQDGTNGYIFAGTLFAAAAIHSFLKAHRTT